jgi:uncharacterized protein (DUF169 family)
MIVSRRRQFIDRWETYFPGAELPIVFSYSDEEAPRDKESTETDTHCLICDLAPVRKGATRWFSEETIRCSGGRRYLGFDTELRPNFAHFLSCGIPGELEGERYKRSPSLVEDYLEGQPDFEAPRRAILFKRWDALDETDSPEVVIFLATPDVLSGLFTLANFDEIDPQAVITPFGSGCSSIVYHPYKELDSDHPRAVLGMFDVSARPCVPPNVLSFAVPWPKFTRMVDQMDESFLITDSWRKVRSRL